MPENEYISRYSPPIRAENNAKLRSWAKRHTRTMASRKKLKEIPLIKKWGKKLDWARIRKKRKKNKKSVFLAISEVSYYEKGFRIIELESRLYPCALVGLKVCFLDFLYLPY